MKREECAITAYSQKVDEFIVDQFLAVGQFLDALCIDDFLYRLPD